MSLGSYVGFTMVLVLGGFTLTGTLVDMEHSQMLVTCKTAKDMWDCLTSIYKLAYEESLALWLGFHFGSEIVNKECNKLGSQKH